VQARVLELKAALETISVIDLTSKAQESWRALLR
jgi:hypothetical protein